ncbi:MAG: hypothetical protein GY711_32835 [bacterium]|nr:hypothetical protein [bacterium]
MHRPLARRALAEDRIHGETGVVGASVRLFFKITLLAAIVLLAMGYLAHKVGWMELPGSSLGEAWREIGLAVGRQTERVKDFLSGYLPAGAATVTGLGTGLTRRPQFDDDTD